MVFRLFNVGGPKTKKFRVLRTIYNSSSSRVGSELLAGVRAKLVNRIFTSAGGSWSLTSSSATLNGRPQTTGDQLPEAGPRNPRSEADRGWLQRLVRLVLLFRIC